MCYENFSSDVRKSTNQNNINHKFDNFKLGGKTSDGNKRSKIVIWDQRFFSLHQTVHAFAEVLSNAKPPKLT